MTVAQHETWHFYSWEKLKHGYYKARSKEISPSNNKLREPIQVLYPAVSHVYLHVKKKTLTLFILLMTKFKENKNYGNTVVLRQSGNCWMRQRVWREEGGEKEYREKRKTQDGLDTPAWNLQMHVLTCLRHISGSSEIVSWNEVKGIPKMCWILVFQRQ